MWNDIEQWREGLASEIAFWDSWLATEGREWPEEYRDRVDPDMPLQEDLRALLQRFPGPDYEILDVGAGPLTSIGKRWPGRGVRITAVDPLADVFARLLERHHITPLFATSWCHGELLHERFARHQFDLVHARNSLDHSYNPLRAVLLALEVVKVGGAVLLSNHEDEAVAEGYAGLHQWNFSEQGGHFFISNRWLRFNVSRLLRSFAEVEVTRQSHRGLRIVLCKTTAAPVSSWRLHWVCAQARVSLASSGLVQRARSLWV